MTRLARFAASGCVLGMMLGSSCGLRYETAKPPGSEERAAKNLHTFKWQPPLFSEEYSRLPLPKSLQKRKENPRPDDNFIMLK